MIELVWQKLRVHVVVSGARRCARGRFAEEKGAGGMLYRTCCVYDGKFLWRVADS